MYDGLVSVCLKGVLGTKSQQSRIRVIVAVVQQMIFAIIEIDAGDGSGQFISFQAVISSIWEVF